MLEIASTTKNTPTWTDFSFLALTDSDGPYLLLEFGDGDQLDVVFDQFRPVGCKRISLMSVLPYSGVVCAMGSYNCDGLG